MALNIKDPETDRLARELAALTGQSITGALREAIEERIAATKNRRSALGDADLAAIITRGRARAIADTRSEDEILGYDQNGIPS